MRYELVKFLQVIEMLSNLDIYLGVGNIVHTGTYLKGRSCSLQSYDTMLDMCFDVQCIQTEWFEQWMMSILSLRGSGNVQASSGENSIEFLVCLDMLKLKYS